ncbi:MAG: GNAT family N-acetyltransferase [Clostridia bacterium]|nr:GNAT family N-acetyltransferase [Clostridia bacterium]
MIVIKEVTTKKEMKKFCDFPLELYKGNPYYCPPFYADEMSLINPKKNVYSDFADNKFWLAYKDGKVVGRISAIINHAYMKKTGDKCARFTRFDVINDFEVSKALFEVAEKYAKDMGMERINGPMGYCDMDREGMLVEGFDEYQVYGGSYNSPWCMEHVEKLGYVKQTDWIERKLIIPEQVPEKITKFTALIKEKYGLHDIVTNDSKVGKMIKDQKERLFKLLDICYEALHGTVPFTDRVRDNMVASISLIMQAKYLSIIEDKDGNLVGFGFLYGAFWKALNKCKGKLLPTGAFRILRSKKKHDAVELCVIAVHPDWQKRGVTALIMERIMQNLIDGGIKYAETNATLVDNVMINNLWDGFEHVKHKRKRCYVKDLKD